eukprot:GDKJ01031758.1.p1 GENE.GDKJ01031758.1~~GDKJ01031758.1.p1  ORF type:complete len:1236 (-),score=255.90 GDKJ01031758.1:249-3710(-)
MKQIPVVRTNNLAYNPSHAVVCIGWEVVRDRTILLIQNSWGSSSGFNGLYRIYADEGFFYNTFFFDFTTSRVKINQKRLKSKISNVKNTVSVSSPQFLGFALEYENLFIDASSLANVEFSLRISTDAPFSGFHAQRVRDPLNHIVSKNGSLTYSLSQIAAMRKAKVIPSFPLGETPTVALKYFNSVGHRLRTKQKIPFLTDSDVQILVTELRRYQNLLLANPQVDFPISLPMDFFLDEQRNSFFFQHDLFCVSAVYDRILNPVDGKSFSNLKRIIKSLCDQLNAIRRDADSTRARMGTVPAELAALVKYSDSEIANIEKQRVYTSPLNNKHQIVSLVDARLNPSQILAVLIKGKYKFYYHMLCKYFSQSDRQIHEGDCQHLTNASILSATPFSSPNHPQLNEFLNSEFLSVPIRDPNLSFVKLQASLEEHSGFSNVKVPLNFLGPSRLSEETEHKILHRISLDIPALNLEEALTHLQPQANQNPVNFLIVDLKKECLSAHQRSSEFISLCNLFEHQFTKYTLKLNPLVYILPENKIAFTFKCVDQETSQLAPECKSMAFKIKSEYHMSLPFKSRSDDSDSPWRGISSEFHQPFVVSSSLESSSNERLMMNLYDTYEVSPHDKPVGVAMISIPNVPTSVMRILGREFLAERGIRHFSMEEFCHPKKDTLLSELVALHEDNLEFLQTFLVACDDFSKHTQGITSIPFMTDGSKRLAEETSGWAYVSRKWSPARLSELKSAPIRLNSKIFIMKDPNDQKLERNFFKLECVDGIQMSDLSVKCEMVDCQVGNYNSKITKDATSFNIFTKLSCVIVGNSFFIKKNDPSSLITLHQNEALYIRFALSFPYPFRQEGKLILHKYEYMDPALFLSDLVESNFKIRGGIFFDKYVDMTENCSSEFKKLSNPSISPFCTSHEFSTYAENQGDPPFLLNYPITPAVSRTVKHDYAMKLQEKQPIFVIELKENVKIHKNGIQKLLIGVPFNVGGSHKVTKSAFLNLQSAAATQLSSEFDLSKQYLSAQAISITFNIPLNQLALLLYTSHPGRTASFPLKNYLFFVPNSDLKAAKTLDVLVRRLEKTETILVKFRDSVMAPWTKAHDESLARFLEAHSYKSLPPGMPSSISRAAMFEFPLPFCEISREEPLFLWSELLCSLNFNVV